MAKSKPKISLADVPPGMTLVRSRAYGDHVRAKRGTYKKAKLNGALKKGTVLIREANAAAKLFKHAVERYGERLIEKSLWPSLVSMFRRQQTETGTVNFSQIQPFEINSRYTLDKLLPVDVATSYDENTSVLRAGMSYRGCPSFSTSLIDGYKLSAIFLFFDLKKKTAKTVVEESAILSLSKDQSPFDVSVSVPDGAKCFVLCLRIDGSSKGKVYHTIASKGMKVIAAGTTSRK
jgi:hypothetical protein